MQIIFVADDELLIFVTYSLLQATHYTFLASAEVLGKVLFSTIAGILVDRIGFPSSFCVFLLLSGLSLLHVLNPPEILSKQHKQ